MIPGTKRRLSTGLLAALMVTMGVLHFALPAPFARTIPAFIPYHSTLVLVSGVIEIGLGLGLLFTATRRLAAFGLIALYLAVFPANINIALHPAEFGPPLILYLRLPFQVLLIWWAWTARNPPDFRPSVNT